MAPKAGGSPNEEPKAAQDSKVTWTWRERPFKPQRSAGDEAPQNQGAETQDVKDEQPAGGNGQPTPRKKPWTGTKCEGPMRRIKDVRQQLETARASPSKAQTCRSSSPGRNEVQDGKPAWQRLHDDHKERQTTQAQRQEERRQASELEAQMLLQQVMPRERLPAEQIEEITKRLYSDGLEKQKQQKEQAMKDHDRYWAKFFGGKATTDQVSSVFRGVTLYEAFMKHQKRAAARATAPAAAEATEEKERRGFSPQYLQKLVRWGLEKKKRIERRKQEEDLRMEAELESMSVHHGAGISQPARHEMLYLDSLERVPRLKEAQSVRWGVEQKVLGEKERAEHSMTFLQLYKDAQRRAESLKLRRHCLEEQQASELEAQSVHAAAKQSKAWTAKQQQEAIERIARPLQSGQSTPRRPHSAPPRRASPKAAAKLQQGQLPGKQGQTCPKTKQEAATEQQTAATPSTPSREEGHPKAQAARGSSAGQGKDRNARQGDHASKTSEAETKPKPFRPTTPRSSHSTVQVVGASPREATCPRSRQPERAPSSKGTKQQQSSKKAESVAPTEAVDRQTAKGPEDTSTPRKPPFRPPGRMIAATDLAGGKAVSWV